MSILSDHDIAKAIKNKQIAIEPYVEEQLQPSSYDVTLDSVFLTFPRSAKPLDPRHEHNMVTTDVVEGEAFWLFPGDFALGSTRECITVGDTMAARLEGKSSLGRLGLLTHATAGFIDPGFTGHITLELATMSNRPILLWPGMKIGQLAFFDLTSRARVPYSAERGSHYQGQRGPTPSRSWAQFLAI